MHSKFNWTISVIASAASAILISGCSHESTKAEAPESNRGTASYNDVSVMASVGAHQIDYINKRRRCMKAAKDIFDKKPIDENEINLRSDDCYAAVEDACALWNMKQASTFKAIDERHASNFCYLISGYKTEQKLNAGNVTPRCEKAYQGLIANGYAADDYNSGCGLTSLCDAQHAFFASAVGEIKADQACHLFLWSSRLEVVRSMIHNLNDLP